MQLSKALLQGVEAAITLLFESGEAASEEMVKTNCGALGPLALGSLLVEFINIGALSYIIKYTKSLAGFAIEQNLAMSS